jgi:hypothetical protein
MADPNPYDAWPGQELPEHWDTPKPMTADAGKPGGPPTIPQAISSSLPTWGEAGNYLLPRAEYVGQRFLRGIMQPDQTGYAPYHPDVGLRPDVGTGMVGAFAEDLGRNPLLTMAAPVRSAVSAGVGELMTGFPAWERGVAGAAVNLLNPRGMAQAGWNALQGAGLGEIIHGLTGAKIGTALALLPHLWSGARNLLQNPVRSSVLGTGGAYQAQPQGIPAYSDLSLPAK